MGEGLRRALSLVPMLATLSIAGCLLAPPPAEGLGIGLTCTADLDCAVGLVCACGECTDPADDDAPGCTVLPENRCTDVPSECLEACGVEVAVGLAQCVAGRETCDFPGGGGVLRDDCPADTCWGEPGVGEVCIDGLFSCEFGRNEATDLCYTFDCEGEPEVCAIEGCNSTATGNQICLGGEWRCEVGFPARQCGCLGDAPSCYDCDTLEPVFDAQCNTSTNTFSCESFPGADLLEACCAGPDAPAGCNEDAGTPDAGPGPDAGSVVDGGTSADAGADAGAGTDGGTATDAGSGADGGSTADAGPDAGAPDAG